jgi:HSP20 family molecular chaperone IbpA
MSMVGERPDLAEWGNFVQRWMDVPTRMLQEWLSGPIADVREDDRHVHVRLEVPGVDPQHLEVTVGDHTLTVRGTYHQDREDEERGWASHRQGTFYRSVPLPAEVDADQATASCRHGVLRIDLPKRQEGRGRRIPVTVDGPSWDSDGQLHR